MGFVYYFLFKRWSLLLLGTIFALYTSPALQTPTEVPTLKTDAFNILNTKCNSCHKRQNPFMVFTLKNMEKRAPKIYKQVFVLQRMPKNNATQLSEQQYATLKEWINTQTNGNVN